MSDSARKMLFAAGGCAVVGICLLLGVLAVIFLFSIFATGGRQADRRVSSPDGSKILVTSVNTSQADPTQYLTVNFEIRDVATDIVLFDEQTGASSRLAWDIKWLSNSEIQLDSSDIGTFCWQEQPGGFWTSVACP